MDLASFNGFLGQVEQTATLVAAIGVVLTPVVGPIIAGLVSRARRARLLKVTKAAYKVVAELSAQVKMPAADGLARLLRLVEDELHRGLSDEEVDFVTRVGASMHADPGYAGKLGEGVADALLPDRLTVKR